MQVRNPTDAVRPKIIWPVHPTVTHRPLWTAVKRVDDVRVVQRHLVLAERVEVVVQRADGHGVEETRTGAGARTRNWLWAGAKTAAECGGVGWGPRQGEAVVTARCYGTRLSPPPIKQIALVTATNHANSGCHRHQ